MAGGAGESDFEEFCDREYRRAVDFAFSLTGSTELADVIVAEALELVRPVFGTGDPAAQLRISIMHRWRSRDRRRVVAIRHRVEPLGPEEASRTLVAVLELPWRERAATVLHYWQQWPDEDIARALGCSVKRARRLRVKGLLRIERRERKAGWS